MSNQLEKYINVVPNIRVKDIKKDPKNKEEDPYLCRLCTKGFASDIALRNHARMEHVDAYLSGDPNVWMKVNEKATVTTEVVPIKQEEPTYVMTLASQDVSYIIVREQLPDKRKKVAPKKEKVQKKTTEPITGPFECLQPSALVPGGTCHQMFFSCCEYSLHFRSEHTRRKKGARCQVCERPLANSDQPAPYPCLVCGTGFQTSKELSEHTAVAHVKLKPFQCSVCLKRFTQQGGVQQHMRMHTGDRPFPCTFCPKAFTQKSGLDQHLRIHTKLKPYRCVVCGKTFCQSVHLKQHMRTHNNVTPFQCGVCAKKFKQSSHLNYHLKNHNPPVADEEGAKIIHFDMVNDEVSDQEIKMEEEEIVEEEGICLEEGISLEQGIEIEQVEGVQVEEVDNEWILPHC